MSNAIRKRISKKITKALHDFNLIEDGDKVLIAVSGGKQDQDEVAAWAALDVIREVIDSEAGYMLGRDFLKKYDCVDGEVNRYQAPSED